MHSHHILSYDQQRVSDITHCVKVRLIASYDQQEVSHGAPHFVRVDLITSLLWSTGSEWHCKAVSSYLYYDQQVVSDIAHLGKGSLFPIWPTESMWYCTFCEKKFHDPHCMTNRKWMTFHICETWQSHHILSYNQQQVNDIVHLVMGSLITFHMTDSLWVTWHILWKTDSSHLLL